MADLQDFDFDAAQRDAWTAFAQRLDTVLSVMDGTEDLTISVASAGERPGIRFTVEQPHAVTGIFLSPEGGLSEEMVGSLLEAGWQQHGEELRVTFEQEHSDQLAALTSHTLSEVLGVLHPVFLAPDQLAEILQGEEPLERLPERQLRREVKAVMPADRADLDALVDEEIQHAFGHPPLRNEQGDVAIRVGSTMVFLRSTPDGEELLLFSPLVHDVGGRSRACEVLNDLNVESRYGRFALHRDRVYVQLSVAAKPFVAAHLGQAFRIIASIADGIDDDLAAKLGGRTTFGSA